MHGQGAEQGSQADTGSVSQPPMPSTCCRREDGFQLCNEVIPICVSACSINMWKVEGRLERIRNFGPARRLDGRLPASLQPIRACFSLTLVDTTDMLALG